MAYADPPLSLEFHFDLVLPPSRQTMLRRAIGESIWSKNTHAMLKLRYSSKLSCKRLYKSYRDAVIRRLIILDRIAQTPWMAAAVECAELHYFELYDIVLEGNKWMVTVSEKHIAARHWLHRELIYGIR